jgi:hypothetical protein
MLNDWSVTPDCNGREKPPTLMLIEARSTLQPQALRDLGLTSNQVWGLTKTDQDWSEKLESALIASRRNDLRHGTTPAYVRGCVCSECREWQRIRMARNR